MMCKPIKNIISYLEAITDISVNIKSDAINNEYFLFRGQSSEEYALTPSIARGGLLQFEATIYSNAMYTLPSVFANMASPIDFLAKLQQYQPGC